MNLYEHVVIMAQEAGQNQIRFTLNKYKKIIEKHSGTICSCEFWGLRKLAYAIKKQEKAFYFLLNLQCTHKLISELSLFASNNHIVLRHLTLKTEKFELNSELKAEDTYGLLSELSSNSAVVDKVD